MSDYKRQRRPRRLLDRFKKPVQPTETPSYDLGGGDTPGEPTTTGWWSTWRKDRRKFVIERKEAQAGVAKHRKWVLMWGAIIVVAVVILALATMNKLSITGWVF